MPCLTISGHLGNSMYAVGRGNSMYAVARPTAASRITAALRSRDETPRFISKCLGKKANGARQSQHFLPKRAT